MKVKFGTDQFFNISKDDYDRAMSYFTKGEDESVEFYSKDSVIYAKATLNFDLPLVFIIMASVFKFKPKHAEQFAKRCRAHFINGKWWDFRKSNLIYVTPEAAELLEIQRGKFIFDGAYFRFRKPMQKFFLKRISKWEASKEIVNAYLYVEIISRYKCTQRYFVWKFMQTILNYIADNEAVIMEIVKTDGTTDTALPGLLEKWVKQPRSPGSRRKIAF